MRARALLTAAVAVLAAATTIATAPATASVRPASHPAGSYSAPFTLATFANMVGYDVASASDGTAYIGWISDDGAGTRLVHLCTLPVDASACVGGIQTTSALDDIDARDLHVLVRSDGTVVLVWQDITTSASPSTARGDEIMAAYAPGGANLSSANVMADAPSYGDLMGVQYGPDGTVWTLEYPGLPATTLELRTNWVDTPQTLQAGYQIGSAQLAIAGGKPFVSFSEAGTVTRPDHWGTVTSTGGFAFHTLANTWTAATDPALVETGHGPRIVTSTNNATYRPIVSAWTGSTFSPPHFTADRTDVSGCTPVGHDAYADRSGRFLDASYECGGVALTHFVNAYDSVVQHFPAGGVTTFAPQVASGTRGIATLVWSTEPSGAATSPLRLWVRRVRLPDLTHLSVVRSYAGAVSVTGPVSCLPPSDVAVASNAGAARGWRTVSRSLRLGSTSLHSSGTLDGASLTPGASYTLTSSATFVRGRSSRTVTAAQTFTACAAS